MNDDERGSLLSPRPASEDPSSRPRSVGFASEAEPLSPVPSRPPRNEKQRSPRTSRRNSVQQVVDKAVEQRDESRPSAPSVLDRFVVVPERGSSASHWTHAWDILTSLLVLVCAYLIPFTLALPTVARAEVAGFNHVLDVCFTLDLVFQFFLAYRNAEHSDTLWEKSFRGIAKRYCGIPLSEKGEGGWFWMDAASVLPGWATLVIGGKYARVQVALRSLRLLRCLRLTKLSRKIEETQATTGLPFFISDIMKFVFITTFVSHTAACMWVMLEGKVNPDLMHSSESWLSALRKGKGDCCEPDAEHDPLCVYNFAVYWAMMTLTSVGYGDITPQNSFEYFVCTLFMLLAGFVWAYVVGSVVSLLSQIDPVNEKFKALLDQLNVLIEQRNLSPHLRSKLREYMVVAKNIGRTHHQRSLLENNISPGLQREVVLETPVIQIFKKNVYWAKGLEQDAILEIIRLLKTYIYGKQESIPIKHRMLLVREGIVAVSGRIVSRNEFVGEKSILLASEHLTNDNMPKTLSYVTVLSLTRAALVGVCQQYPLADQRLRQAQIRTAVWRGFIKSAAEQKSLKQKRGRSMERMRLQAVRPKPRQGFVRSLNQQGRAEAIVTASELKDVENHLGRGQTELRYQLRETRELLAMQKKMMLDIAAEIEAQKVANSSSLFLKTIAMMGGSTRSTSK